LVGRGAAFVAGLGLAMLIAAARVAAAAAFVSWRAPSAPVTSPDRGPTVDRRVIQSLERG
jgi:hypothetical protein